MFKLLAPLGIALAGLLFLQGCGSEGYADGATPPYRHQVITREIALQNSYRVEREFAGEIQAGQSSQLGFEFPGRVDALYVNIGNAVSKGELLARLDTRLLQSEGNELAAQRAELAAELDTTERNLARIKRLQAESLASERELDDLTGRTLVLEASLQRVDAALEANAIRLGNSELRAPFDAVIASRLVDSGTVIDAGTPVFRLVESGVREIRAGVPVTMATRLKVGDEVKMRNGQDLAIGEIAGISPEVDQATRSRSLRVHVHENWSPGDLAYLQIEVPVDLQGTWLPDSAVTEGARGTWVVYAAIDQGDAEALLESRSVVIHHVRGNELFVSGALENGDRIVVSGLHRLAPGQVVRPGLEEVLADAR